MKNTSPLLIGICAVLACTTLGLLGFLFFGNGFGDDVTPAKVAVVDLDKVALELGRVDAMNQKLKNQGTNLDEQLKDIKDKLQSQVTAKENELKQMGQQVTPEQKKQLVGMLQAANSQYDLAKRKAIAVVQQHKAVMIQQFRKEAIDVAREVAKSKGFDMVIAKNPTVVLSYDSSFDITDAVIEAMPATAEEPQQEVASQGRQPAAAEVAQRNETSYR